jgi:hypothetical protein
MYSVYNIKSTKTNNNLIYISLNSIQFPWEIINKKLFLKFDFIWGLKDDSDKQLLMSALSNEVKEISTYIVSSTPYIHFLDYISKKQFSYELAWVFNETKYDMNSLKDLVGSEFQIEKIKNIFLNRKDVSVITSLNNVVPMNNDYSFFIKQSLSKLLIPILFYTESELQLKKVFEKFHEVYVKETKDDVIENRKSIKNSLLNQKKIPKILKDDNFVIRVETLTLFFKQFKNILLLDDPKNILLTIKHFLGIYIGMIACKKFLTVSYSNVENILTIVACHINSESCFNRYTKPLIQELAKYSKKIKIIYSGIHGINFSDSNSCVEFSHVENKGYDCGKWYIGLSNENLIEYDRFLLINDSICALRGLSDFFSYAQGRPTEVIGLIDSNEIKYHLQSHCRFYTLNGIIKAMPFFDKCLKSNLSIHDLKKSIISNFETNINIWKDYESYYSIDDIDYKKNIHFDLVKLKQKICVENYPICKVSNELAVRKIEKF